MILMRDRARMSGSEGTARYTVRLRLRVTKQGIQRTRKLLISNLTAAAGAHKPPAPGSHPVRMSRWEQERYWTLSLPDMMSKWVFLVLSGPAP